MSQIYYAYAGKSETSRADDGYQLSAGINDVRFSTPLPSSNYIIDILSCNANGFDIGYTLGDKYSYKFIITVEEPATITYAVFMKA
jgi:hypothetical protein